MDKWMSEVESQNISVCSVTIILYRPHLVPHTQQPTFQREVSPVILAVPRSLECTVFIGHVPRGGNAKLEHRDCSVLVGAVVSPRGRTGTCLRLFTPDKWLYVGPAPKNCICRA